MATGNKPLVVSRSMVHKEIQALISFVALNKLHTEDPRTSKTMEVDLFKTHHLSCNNDNNNNETLSFVQQLFVQGECAFEGAFEEDIDVTTRMDAEKEKSP